MLTNNTIEVRDERTKSYFKAFLKDFTTTQVLVAYENDWRPPAWHDLLSVRAAPLAGPVPPTFPAPNEHVEVQATTDSSPAVPASWFPGIAVNAKRGVCLVKFDNGSEDMVELEKIRPAAPSTPLDLSHLVRTEFPLDLMIVNYCRQEHIHDDFVRVTGLLSASVTDRGTLVVVGDRSAIDKAGLLAPIHLRGVYDLARLRPLMQPVSAVREADYLVEERFAVPRELIGLAIGKKGANINRAREVVGVTDIAIDDATGTFIVRGKTRAAVDAARAVLEVTEATLSVPATEIGMVIGKGGRNLQDITERSQVLSIRVHDPPANAPPDAAVAVVITGSRDAVENARLLIDFQVKSAQAMSELAGDFGRASIDRRMGGPDRRAPGAYRGDRDGRDGRDGRENRERARQPMAVADVASPRDPRRRQAPQNGAADGQRGDRPAAGSPAVQRVAEDKQGRPKQPQDGQRQARGGAPNAAAAPATDAKKASQAQQGQGQQGQGRRQNDAQAPRAQTTPAPAHPQPQPQAQPQPQPQPQAQPQRVRAPATRIVPAVAGDKPAQTNKEKDAQQQQQQQAQQAPAGDSAAPTSNGDGEKRRRGRKADGAAKEGAGAGAAPAPTVAPEAASDGAAPAEGEGEGKRRRRGGKGRGGAGGAEGSGSPAPAGEATAAPAAPGAAPATTDAAPKEQRPPRQRRRKEGGEEKAAAQGGQAAPEPAASS